jgi:hypothetical protein
VKSTLQHYYFQISPFIEHSLSEPRIAPLSSFYEPATIALSIILDSEAVEPMQLPLLIDRHIFESCISLCGAESYPLKQIQRVLDDGVAEQPEAL